MKRYSVTLLTISTLLIVSCVFAGLSVFLPATIHNRSELKQVNLGFPISYIVQNQSALPVGYPDGPSFPIRQTLISPWEYPFRIIWWRFFLNIAAISIAFNLIYFVTKFFYGKNYEARLLTRVSPVRPKLPNTVCSGQRLYRSAQA